MPDVQEEIDSPPETSRSRFNVFRAVRHVHQSAEKFRFELWVEECIIRLPNPHRISIEWIRGGNQALHRLDCIMIFHLFTSRAEDNSVEGI